MIYGYALKTVDPEYGLLQMREVSFQFRPSELRTIAEFLRKAAEDMETGEFRGDHRHLASADSAWPKSNAGIADIIVLRDADAS